MADKVLRSLNALMAKTMADAERLRAWEATTPLVVWNDPYVKPGKPLEYQDFRVGKVKAITAHTSTGTNGTRQEPDKVHIWSSAHPWSKVAFRLRLMDPQTEKDVAELDARIRDLYAQRRALLKERFLQMEPVPWEMLLRQKEERAALRAD